MLIICMLRIEWFYDIKPILMVKNSNFKLKKPLSPVVLWFSCFVI